MMSITDASRGFTDVTVNNDSRYPIVNYVNLTLLHKCKNALMFTFVKPCAFLLKAEFSIPYCTELHLLKNAYGCNIMLKTKQGNIEYVTLLVFNMICRAYS